ncbi:MAG: hypothetical protein RXS42_03035 [Nitrososphaeria archaeon]|jgi:hypothetical protein
MARTNLAVDRDVAERLSEEARAQGKTLYALTNEILRACIDIYRDGGNARQAAALWRASNIMRDLDLVPVPLGILEWLIDSLGESSMNGLLEAMEKQGSILGKYLSILYPQFTSLFEENPEVLARLLPAKKVEIVSNEPGGGLRVRLVGIGNSERAARALGRLLEEAVRSYGALKLVEFKYAVGVLELVLAPIDEGNAQPSRRTGANRSASFDPHGPQRRAERLRP